MNHSRQETRANNWKHAIRKHRIAREVDGIMYNNLHQFSKNKIHCSCPNCRGRWIGLGNNSIGQLAITDQKKVQKMKSQLNEINEEVQ